MKKTIELQYFAKDRHATWLELFFDLVIVACIGVVTHNLGHLHDGHLPTKQWLYFPLEFIPVWWIWVTHTLYANFFDTDSKSHRISTLMIMFLMVSMSAFLGKDLQKHYAHFIGFYLIIRTIGAFMFFSAVNRIKEMSEYARQMTITIIITLVIAGVALMLEAPYQQIVFIFGIILEVCLFVLLGSKRLKLPVHRSHLVERIGLLSIILLGETVISLVSGLREIEWTVPTIVRAISGFLLIGSIWWIYFDSFPVLERAKRIRNGFVVILPNAFFCIGLILLATMIRHSIMGELGRSDFQILAIFGMIFFYFGKQIIYYVSFPVYRKHIIINSVVCVTVTALSSFLPKAEYAMIGITLGMFFYVYSTFRWILTKDVSPYLVEEDE